MSRSFMFHFQRPFTNNTNEKSERLQKKEPCPDIFPDKIPFYYVLLLCSILSDQCLCVVGNEHAIREESGMFTSIQGLCE